MGNWLKRNGIHFLIAAIFLIVCFIYFTPAFQGKTLGQNDVTRAQSTQKEINDYRANGTTILWTNQILGGMPTFQIWAPYPGSIATHIVNFLDTAFPAPIYIVFLLLFGSYFLFNVLKVNPWLAAAGALAFSFSSYNIIYIAAGHANQEFAIALFAPIVASIILVTRGKYLLGSSLLALFLSIEIKANHIQMTYYLMIALLILLVIELYNGVKTKNTSGFFKSLGYIAAATLVALLVNASLLWSTAEYSGGSIRGKANLTQTDKKPGNGVARDYAYEYSEGVGETLSFLVPNAYGGASSGPEGTESHVAKLLVDKGVSPEQAQGVAQSLPLYWGNKPFTDGPWYFGAVICFLFVFGLMVVKDRIKWWLLATVILAMLLSFGYNFPFVSDLFFNYFPLFNKFRAVESILAVAMLCVPVLGILALQQSIVETDKKELFKKAKIALYITGGLALLLAVLPGVILSFKSNGHQDLISKISAGLTGGNVPLATDIVNALVQDRASAAKADAIRSLIFVLIGFGILWAWLKQKVNVTILSLAFLVLILADLWMVDKRYLKNEAFVDKQESLQPQPRPVDLAILQDKDPDYRVIDLSQNLMQDATTPYFHKSIGGYSAARFKRIDELVDNQFAKGINPAVLDMLNTKYIINADTGRSLKVMANPAACGNAWFVRQVKYVANADEEMQALNKFSPKDEAIVDQQYKGLLKEIQPNNDTTGTIKLTAYNPDHLTYQSTSKTGGIAVFSEIYYNKGWNMLIDGAEQPYFRADYLLRAASIPAGNHKIEFIFHPASYYTGEKISMAGSVILILALGGAVYAERRRKTGNDKK
ncbi:YfhO family protein [Mucilaginibacter sp. BJC16-A38]|uniref:YfhO family protein n=1 Tax=Mucilaginibacter phenanthrenivorans TaxID=1234842 RepID=UPI0021570953|nr:YfhO family protein [Mucilaginibacter phenanthrenivorans]MCR8558564.1 YfhO family protein [Mucilaginibacter phenanthrenivorans]